MKTYRIGIDLGGTKIAVIALDEHNQVAYQNRASTPQKNYTATVEQIGELVAEAEQYLKQKCSIGIGTPGALSPDSGLIKNANSTCLNGKPLAKDLEIVLDREIRLSNDANCFILSESFDGAAKNAAVAFGVIIGTGTGAGIVINNQVLEGANKIAGEWGHNPMPWPDSTELPGAECYCGLRGCIETFLSGPGLEADYYLNYNQTLDTFHIVDSAKNNIPQCISTLERYERRLAKALAHVINILDPEIIVLGGGISNIQRLYQNVPKIWGEYIFSDVVKTKLCAPRFGDASGVRGAARLWGIGD